MIKRLAIVLAVVAVAFYWTRPVQSPGTGNPPRWTDPVSGIELVLVPAQTFQMGSPAPERGREEQEVLHPVTLTRPYYIGKYEVTQGEWTRVMGRNPSHFAGCDRCPVERVNMHDIQAFLARLNQQSRPGFRLPTEAEWELACRAGGAEPFGHRSTLSSRDANIDGTYPYNAPQGTARNQTTTVGRFPANPWGIHDMAGNVWEWVQDRHCPYSTGPVTDPLATCDSEYHVIRGGSWKFDGNSARCALRYTHRPQDLGFSLGFRLAKDAN